MIENHHNGQFQSQYLSFFCLSQKLNLFSSLSHSFRFLINCSCLMTSDISLFMFSILVFASFSVS